MRYALLVMVLLPTMAFGASVPDTLKPTGEGTTANWGGVCPTNSWECVDEDASDSVTTRIQIAAGDGANVVHQFTFEDPTEGTLDSAILSWHLGYTSGPPRQIDVRYDSGAGFVLVGDYDLGVAWVRGSVKFTTPDSLHITNMQIEVENLEQAKSDGTPFYFGWAELIYWYEAAAGADTYEGRVIIIQ